MTTQYEYGKMLEQASVMRLEQIFAEYKRVVPFEKACEGKYKGREVTLCSFYQWGKGTPRSVIEKWFYDHGVE